MVAPGSCCPGSSVLTARGNGWEQPPARPAVGAQGARPEQLREQLGQGRATFQGREVPLGPNLCPLRGGPGELPKGQELALGLSGSLPRLSVTLKMAFEAAQLLPKEPAALSTQDGADACLSLDTVHAPAGTVCVDRGSQGDERRAQRPRHTAGGCCHCPADTGHHKTGTAEQSHPDPHPGMG